MKYPITEFYKEEGVINQAEFLKTHPNHLLYAQKLKELNINTVLYVFTRELESLIKNKLELLYTFITASQQVPVYIYNKKFLILSHPVGAPMANGIMEELGCIGITNFFACGSAGLINHDIDSSNLILVNRAIRDEGSSYKYLKPSVYAYPDEELTNYMANYLTNSNLKFITSTTWTTDAFFRETPKCIEKRKKQGAVCVEMECSAWCATAKYHGYKFAQLLYTSDALHQEGWKLKTREERESAKENIIKFMIKMVISFVKQNKGML